MLSSTLNFKAAGTLSETQLYQSEHLQFLTLKFINLQGFPSYAAQNYHRKAHHRDCKYLEACHSTLPQSEGFSERSISGVGVKEKTPNIFPACLNRERLIKCY